MSDASGSGHAEASQDEDALPTLTLEQTMALLIQDFVHGRAQMPPPLSLPLPATIHDTATAGDVAPGVSAVSDAGASDRDSLHETEAAHTADENDHENGNQVASDNESEISIDAPAAPPICNISAGYERQVIGVDISPIQPHSFEIDDVEREWVWPDYFDFIFVRHMNACFASWPDFLARAFNHLEPGGFIELHDNAFPILCPDNTMPPTSAIARWSAMLMEATSAIGRPIDAPRHFKAMLEEAGFEAVVEKKRVWPVSPWSWDPKMRALGWWVQAGSLAGLEASILKLGTGVLGWSRSEVLEFCEEIKTELREARVHGYWEV
ncbi:uncharacterized protein N0V96_010081 [Colletotrichum fioriniae]|uniref:uncharacterized protein n=1 Tax=Colletotrichum fioriniae TaxID=710243 RepID=UPI0032DBB323|nr:hypothetical protein N0V96_010081 [Colletotrichum fioriniae]